LSPRLSRGDPCGPWVRSLCQRGRAADSSAALGSAPICLHVRRAPCSQTERQRKRVARRRGRPPKRTERQGSWPTPLPNQAKQYRNPTSLGGHHKAASTMAQLANNNHERSIAPAAARVNGGGAQGLKHENSSSIAHVHSDSHMQGCCCQTHAERAKQKNSWRHAPEKPMQPAPGAWQISYTRHTQRVPRCSSGGSQPRADVMTAQRRAHTCTRPRAAAFSKLIRDRENDVVSLEGNSRGHGWIRYEETGECDQRSHRFLSPVHSPSRSMVDIVAIHL
jgi:hypothetical protein